MFGRNLKTGGAVLLSVIAVIVMSLSGYSGSRFLGFEEEESIPYAQLPAAVKLAAEKYLGTDVNLEAEKEMEGGILFYEVGVKAGGLDREVKLTETGDVVEAEEEISASQLPPAVLAQLNKAFPGATVKKAESVQLFYYEVKILINGKKREVEIFPYGKIRRKTAGLKAQGEKEDEHEEEDEDEDEHELKDEDKD